MKFLVAIALIAIASADMCLPGDKAKIGQVKSAVRFGATLLFGSSCPSLANNIEKVLFAKQCKNLARQGSCYAFRTAERYADHEGPVSYLQLAAGVDNVAELGQLACNEGAACYGQVAKAVKKCMKSNKNFVAETVAAAELAYRANAEQQVSDFVDSQADTLFGEIAGLLMERVSGIEDVEAYLNNFFSEDEQAEIKSDAEAAADRLLALGQGFCDSGCFAASGSFLKALFTGMHGDQCLDATQFCGGCQANTHAFFNGGGATMPCCLDTVVQAGIDAFEYVAEKYGDKAEEFAGLVSDELSDAANAKAAAIGAEVMRQAGCIEEAYGEHRPECA